MLDGGYLIGLEARRTQQSSKSIRLRVVEVKASRHGGGVVGKTVIGFHPKGDRLRLIGGPFPSAATLAVWLPPANCKRIAQQFGFSRSSRRNQGMRGARTTESHPRTDPLDRKYMELADPTKHWTWTHLRKRPCQPVRDGGIHAIFVGIPPPADWCIWFGVWFRNWRVDLQELSEG